MAGKAGRPPKPPKLITPPHPQELVPYKAPPGIESIKDRELTTLEAVTLFLSDLINVVKNAGDDSALQRQAIVLGNLANTSIKAIKEQINNSPEGQAHSLNKLKALTALAKGLPPHIAKQILLEKNFHLLETLDMVSAKKVEGAATLEDLIPDGNGKDRPGQQYDPKKATEIERLTRDRDAAVEKVRIGGIDRAYEARAILAGRRRDANERDSLKKFLEPSYNLDGNAEGYSPTITVQPAEYEAKPAPVRPPDLSWIE